MEFFLHVTCFLGECIGTWISTTVASSEFFLLLYELNNRDSANWVLLLQQLSSQNFANLESLKLKFLLRSGFGYMAQHLSRTATYYEMPNMKCDGTKLNSDFKRKTGDA